MSQEVLVHEESEGVAVLTLARPDARNALNLALQGALIDAFEALARRDDVAAVILTGQGKAFCAGFDLKELASGVGGGDGQGRQQELAAAIAGLPQPLIAAVNGFAITGGFELALACDILIASERARFADTHTRVGMVAGWGLSQRLPRLIGIYRAKELSLTGAFLEAPRAEAWGLVNRVVPHEELLPAARALAREIAAGVPAATRETKRLIDEGYALPFGEALPFELEAAVGWARRVSGADIGARSSAVIERGREHAEGD